MTLNPALALLEQALVDPAPWLRPYLPIARSVLSDAHAFGIVDALNRHRPLSLQDIQFEAHSALPPGEAYEAFIARTARVPTRDNLHDFFNGLVWLTHPHTKRRLNQLQASEIARTGIRAQRGAVRDALTLFDENAAVLGVPPVLVEALRRRDWSTLFVTQRAFWSDASIVIFGHALLEKLLHPRKAMTAHVWLVDAIDDVSIAATLTSDRLAAKDFLPLPVLGVPGWCVGNEAPAFYTDAAVFRSAR